MNKIFIIILISVINCALIHSQNGLDKAISEYAKQKKLVNNNKYTTIYIDSTIEHYFFDFFPQSEKILMSNSEYFPNCLDSINGNHLLIWYNETCNCKNALIEKFNTLGLIDSFFIKPHPTNLLFDEFPKRTLDGKYKAFHVVIDSKSLQVVLRTYNDKKREELRIKK